MINAIQSLVDPKVQDLKPYLPGKSIKEIQEKYQIEDVIKLVCNENAWGCSTNALKALQNTLMEDISFYPNTYLHPFFNCLQEFLDIPKENLYYSQRLRCYFFPINTGLCHITKKTLTHQYALMGYEIQSESFGINCLKAMVDPETWQYQLTDLISFSHFNVAIIFLSNPNNPTGQKISWDDIEKLLRMAPNNCLVVIDEAYYEFDDQPHPNLNYLLKKYSRLIITPTFSKACGLASLRPVYAIANQEVIDTLKRIQLPFTINQIALNSGLAAVNDQDFIQKTAHQTKIGKQFLETELKKLPIITRSCHGNFVTIELKEEVVNLVNFLEANGITMRPLNAFGLNQCAHITIGQPYENARLVRSLQNYFA